MDLIELLSKKGYLFQSDEPGFFLRCADATLQYQTWNPTIRPTRRELKAPFGLIYAKEGKEKGAEVLYDKINRNWRDFSYNPKALALCTSKCNLNCSYCIIGVSEGEKFGFPSIEQLEKAFKLFPLKRVEITGGEPLAERDNLEKILDWLIGRVERCDLVTNGIAWDDHLWPLLRKCGRDFNLRIILTLSEDLAHMKLTEFETKLLPQAVKNPEVKINLNFIPNYDGSGLARFLRRVNQLELPEHITVAPICLLESKFSGPVTFNMENFITEMIEAIENEDEYLCKVNFTQDNDLQLLVHNPQLLGCQRGKITLSDKGYALCHMFLREGEFSAGPLETAFCSWGVTAKQCRSCKYYPDHCREAIKSDKCLHFAPGCNRCPIVYICLLRCPYISGVRSSMERDVSVGDIDLQCLGHSMLRMFGAWLLYRNRSWDEMRGEISTMED